MIKNQELMKLINGSDLVKEYCGIPKDWKDIVDVKYNSVTRRIGENQYQTNFYGTRKFKDSITTNILLNMKREGVWRHLERKYGQAIDLSYLNSKVRGLVSQHNGPQEFVTLTNFNPDANPETSSVDGYVYYNPGVDTTFTALRDQATGSATGANDASGRLVAILATTTTDRYSWMWRSYFLFDTSSLTSGQQVDSATLKLYGTGAVDNMSQSIVPVSGAPASNTALATSDYNKSKFGTTAFASTIAFGSWNTAGYNDFALNASGIAAIDVAGVSKFATRLESDRANSAPTWSSAAQADISGNFADNGSNEPTLSVTHSDVPSGNASAMMLLGIG